MRKVKSIGNNAFKECKGIGVVILPENNFDKLKDIILNQTNKHYAPWRDSNNLAVKVAGYFIGFVNKMFKNNYIAFGTMSDIKENNKEKENEKK